MKKFISIVGYILLALGIIAVFFAGAIFMGWTAAGMNGLADSNIKQTEETWHLIITLSSVGAACTVLGIIFNIKNLISKMRSL